MTKRKNENWHSQLLDSAQDFLDSDILLIYDDATMSKFENKISFISKITKNILTRTCIKTHDLPIFLLLDFGKRQERLVHARPVISTRYDFKMPNQTCYVIEKVLKETSFSLTVEQKSDKLMEILFRNASIYEATLTCPLFAGKKHKKELGFPFQDKQKVFKWNNKLWWVRKAVERLAPGELIPHSAFTFANFRGPKRLFNERMDDTINIIYDIETCVIDNTLVCYMICACVVDYYPPFQFTKQNHFEPCIILDKFYYFEQDYNRLHLNRAAIKFHNWVMEQGKRHTPHNFFTPKATYMRNINIIGFNSNRFDINFVIKTFRTRPGAFCQFNARSNKWTKALITLRQTNYYGDTFMTGKHQANYVFNCYFQDLIAFIPDSSLKKACKDYNVKMAKTEFDILKYNRLVESNKAFHHFTDTPQDYLPNLESYTEYLKDGLYDLDAMCLDYCRMDVESTAELFQIIWYNFEKIRFDIFNSYSIIIPDKCFIRYISAPQLAFKIFTRFLQKNEDKLIKFNSETQCAFNYASYYGGRVNHGFIGKCTGDFVYYDVTSEYPLAMTGEYPCAPFTIDPDIAPLQEILDQLYEHRNYLFDSGTYFETRYFKRLYTGIFMCDIFPPTQKWQMISWSPVPTRFQSKNMYFNLPQYNRVLNTVHMKTCIFMGWRVKLKSHANNILFHATSPIFNDFIRTFGQLKTDYTNQGQKSQAKLAKMIMNSISGKMAQRPTNRLYTHISSAERVIENKSFEDQDWSSSYHYLSSFITGNANWILMSQLYRLHKKYFDAKTPIIERDAFLCYCDTDSVIFKTWPGMDIPFCIDENIGTWNYDTQDYNTTWKKEHPTHPIKKLYVYGRKMYALVGEEDHIIDIKLKGLVHYLATNMTLERLDDLVTNPQKFAYEGIAIKDFNARDKDIQKNVVLQHFKKTLTTFDPEKTNILYRLTPHQDDDTHYIDLDHKYYERHGEFIYQLIDSNQESSKGTRANRI